MTMHAQWVVFGGGAIAIGATIGSFLNVAIDRIPADQSLWTRSACEVCGTPIRARDNIPILSYLLLRGKCRDCAAPIPQIYPLIELLGALLGWLAFRRFVPDEAALDAAHIAAFGLYFGFLCALVVLTYTDIRHRIIPDQTSIYAVPFGVAGTALLGALSYDGWPEVAWRESVLGAGLGGALFAAVAVTASFVLRREGLGWGDVKVVAMIGAFLGVRGGMMSLLMGSFTGVALGLVVLSWTRRSTYLPFGPSLALGAATWLLYGDVILAWLFPGLIVWGYRPM